MDTANDFRIRLAEKAIEECEKSLGNLRIQKRKELVKKITQLKSEIQILKYSYMDFKELSEFESTLKISNTAGEVLKKIENHERDFHYLNSKYWLDYLQNLPKLLKRGEIEKASEAIRYFSGDVVSSKKLNDLWLCKVDCGFGMDVITNSQELANRKRIVVAFLPPKQFGNYISEGMFVDAEFGIGELNHTEIRSIKDRLKEVESVILSLL